MKREPQRTEDSSVLYEGRRLKELAARWDTKAAGWDCALQDPACHLNEDNAYELFLKHLTTIVQERHEFCRKHGVIDAGCATGLVLAEILPAFAWGVGVDISSEMIRIAQKKQIPRARFVVGDCFKLDAIVTNAGAVISRGVLLSHYGWPNARELLRSAKAVMVKNGFLLCDFLNQGARSRFTHEPANKTYFEAGEICGLARETGFGRAEVLGEAERRVRLLLAEVGG